MAKWPYNTTTWRDLRQAKLSAQPLCEVCIRREVVEPAQAVDHIVAIAKGGEPFPPLTGLMSLCLPCHSYKTNMEDRPDRKRKLGSAWKGSAVDGGSLDPDDDWNAAPHTRTSAPDDNGHAGEEERAHSPASRAAVGNSSKPGAFASRRSTPTGPAASQKKELVVANNSQLESEKWV